MVQVAGGDTDHLTCRQDAMFSPPSYSSVHLGDYPWDYMYNTVFEVHDTYGTVSGNRVRYSTEMEVRCCDFVVLCDAGIDSFVQK